MSKISDYIHEFVGNSPRGRFNGNYQEHIHTSTQLLQSNHIWSFPYNVERNWRFSILILEKLAYGQIQYQIVYLLNSLETI